MAFLQRASAEIYYTSWGEHGEWITLLNGFMRSSSDFTLLAKGLVKAGFRVLALDNRGTGQTRYTSHFILADLVEDLFAVWEREEIVRSHVVGFSMGGLLAQQLAIREPTCVNSLSLVSSCLHPSQILRPTAFWSSDVEGNRHILEKYVSRSFGERNQGLLRLMAQGIATAVEKNDFLAHAARQLDALRLYEAPSVGVLYALPCPVLLLHGREDAVIPLEEAHRLQGAFANSRLEIAEDTGHLLLAEKGAWLLGMLLSFFAGETTQLVPQ